MRKLNREKSYNFPKVTQVVTGEAGLKPGSSDSKATPSQKPCSPSPNWPPKTKFESMKWEDESDQCAGKAADVSLLIRPQVPVLFGDIQILIVSFF